MPSKKVEIVLIELVSFSSSIYTKFYAKIWKKKIQYEKIKKN